MFLFGSLLPICLDLGFVVNILGGQWEGISPFPLPPGTFLHMSLRRSLTIVWKQSLKTSMALGVKPKEMGQSIPFVPEYTSFYSVKKICTNLGSTLDLGWKRLYSGPFLLV